MQDKNDKNKNENNGTIKIYIVLISVCSHGSFGENCSHLCHCYNNVKCDPFNGTCPNNRCASGWKGDSCSQGNKPKKLSCVYLGI